MADWDDGTDWDDGFGWADAVVDAALAPASGAVAVAGRVPVVAATPQAHDWDDATDWDDNTDWVDANDAFLTPARGTVAVVGRTPIVNAVGEDLMAGEYRDGTVSVTNGSAAVTGSTAVDWSGITTAHIFLVDGDPRYYGIINVSSGTRQLTLAAPYQGQTNPVAAYGIAIDFTINHQLPLIYQNDIGTLSLLRLLAERADLISGGGGGGGGAVNSVFGRTGNVVATTGDYNAGHITETSTAKIMTGTERTKLGGIADGAQVNRLRSSQAQAEAGLDNTTDMSPLTTAQAIAALGGGGGPGGSDTFNAITPESQGAVGDGVTNDAAAFNAAISTAVGSGRLLRGDPAKTYRITTNLNAFTGTLRISDVTFKATNNVVLLRGNPTWAAQNTTLSSLTTSTVNGTTVTRVNLTSTTGITVGAWVSVGSTTVLWPGETNVRWFEAAQVVAVATNVSIDLHRRLLGEESGALNANLRLFVIPNYRLEAARIRVIADGTPSTAGQTNRQYAIELRGGVGHLLVDCHAESWWERFIRFSSCVASLIVRPSWGFLPDIPGSSEAFGYGVQEAGACYGNLTVGMNGGRCRHAYTNGGVNIATYDGTVPWSYGVVINSAVKSSMARATSGAAFDSHGGAAGTTFDTCTSIDPLTQPVGLTLPSGFQQRGYRSRVISCSARGGDVGFRDGAALTNWGALAPCVSEYSAIHASEYDNDGFFLEGVGGVTNTTVVIDGLTCSNGNHGIHVDATNRFDGDLLLRNFTSSNIAGNGIWDDSGRARIQVSGWTARYTGQAAATNPVKVTAINTGSWTFADVTIFRRNATSPLGFIEVAVSTPPLPVTVGDLKWDVGGLPILASGSLGTVVVGGLASSASVATSALALATSTTAGVPQRSTATGVVTFTLDNLAPVGASGVLVKGPGDIVVTCAANVEYGQPGDNFTATNFTSDFSCQGTMLWEVVDVVGAVRKYLIDGATSLSLGDPIVLGADTSGVLPLDQGGTGVTAASNAALLTGLGGLPTAGGTMTGAIAMGGQNLTNVGRIDAVTSVSRAVLISAASYTLLATDNGSILTFGFVGTTTVTVPAATTLAPNANQGFGVLLIATGGPVITDGPGATNITVRNGYFGTVVARNGGGVRAAEGAQAVLIS